MNVENRHLLLRRTVRVALSSRESALPTPGNVAQVRNGLVAVNLPTAFSPIVELDVECGGQPAESGYLVDISVVDRAVREKVAPVLSDAFRREAGGDVADLRALLLACAQRLAPELPAPLTSLVFRASPFRSAMIELASAPRHDPKAPTVTTSDASVHAAFLLTETFEFAASHRLHLPGRTDAENLALFGKCNNPNGHGHNYRIEVAVAVPSSAAQTLDFAAIERMVGAEIMARFDHRNLNLDCPEFAELNPSVEHIAMVSHRLLAPRVSEAGGDLRFVRVWETDKTSCRYPA